MRRFGTVVGGSFSACGSAGVGLLVSVALSAGTHAQTPAFLWLDALGEPLGLSADGSTVLTTRESDDALGLWTAADGFTALTEFGGNPSSSFSRSGRNPLSGDGRHVMGQLPGSGVGQNEAARWSASEGFAVLDGLSGTLSSHGAAASFDGSTVVGVALFEVDPPTALHLPFYWTADAGIRPMPLPDGTTDTPSVVGVSHDGSTAVGNASNGKTGYVWTGLDTHQPELTVIDGLEIADISGDGSTVIGIVDNSTPSYVEAAKWTADGGIELLGLLPGFEESWSEGVSFDGSVIVGGMFDHNGFENAGFVFASDGGLRDVADVLGQAGLAEEIAGVSFVSVREVSDDGLTFAGIAYPPGTLSDFDLFVATIPEPTTAAIGVGMIVLMVRRRATASPQGKAPTPSF